MLRSQRTANVRTKNAARRTENDLLRLFRSFIQTPLGEMMALVSDDALCALEFSGPGRLTRLEARLDRWYAPHAVVDGANDVTKRTRAWLGDYFAGASAGRTIPAGLALDARGAAFELRVWQALRDIPAGTTSTYGAIARQLGSTSASRAVGLANGANPLAIIVPCHRVIGSNGTLTGYGGGLDKKRWLLDHERQRAGGQMSLALKAENASDF